jgi:hypothetical protein
MTQLPPNNPTQLNVKLEDTKPVICGHCQCPFFTQGFSLRSVSALISKSGKEELIAQNVILCANCKQPVGSNPNVIQQTNH